MGADANTAPTLRARVVFVNRYYQPDLSATSQILTDLARHLARSGAEVHVVCSRQLYDQPLARLPASERLDGVRVHRLRTSRFGRGHLGGRALDYLSFYCACAWHLLWLLRRGDIAVAKTDPPLISLVAAATARLRGARLVNWLQDLFPEVASRLGANPLPGPLDRLLRGARDRSLRGARMNVVLGRRMRDHLLDRGIPAERISIIENWAGQEAAPASPAHSRLRLALGLRDRFVAAYSGNLGRAHDYRAILEAATLLQPDARFVLLMIGGGAGMDALRAAAQQRRLGNLLFLPYQPRETLADSLAAADVHLATLLPELEGLIVPSKFYGILAAARPVLFIGDAHGELPGIIHDEGCGATVASGDGAALAQALRRLQADPDGVAAMGRRAHALFLRQYTAARALGQWTQLLQVTAV
jgi:glycosyltransferase involved in cell wall biosynthesis